MPYQQLWFIECQSHPCIRTVVDERSDQRVYTFPKGTSPKVNKTLVLTYLMSQSSTLPTIPQRPPATVDTENCIVCIYPTPLSRMRYKVYLLLKLHPPKIYWEGSSFFTKYHLADYINKTRIHNVKHFSNSINLKPLKKTQKNHAFTTYAFGPRRL